MAIPLMVLYEVSIFVAKFARRNKPAPEEDGRNRRRDGR